MLSVSTEKLLWFELLVVLITTTVNSEHCPRGKYGAGCLGSCICDWQGTSECDSQTGACTCQEGFSGRRCDSDINECDASKPPCQRPNTHCQNTLGSYECVCQDGFTKSSLGNCIPCGKFTFGKNCSRQCDCHVEGTLHCQGQQGCLCHIGWTGERCEDSIDDCVGVICPEHTMCVDSHRDYECSCGPGFLLMDGECHEYQIVAASDNYAPGVQELVDIFILYKVPPAFGVLVQGVPEIGFELVIDGDNPVKLCYFKKEVDFQKAEFDAEGNILEKKLKVELNSTYYSNIKIRFTEPKETVLKFVPTKKSIFPPLQLFFDVRYKSSAVKNCLDNMTIVGTGSSYKEPRSYERQRTILLELKWNPNADCVETPQVEWDFYFPTEYKGACPSPHIYLWESLETMFSHVEEERLVTDAKSLLIVLPRGILNLGIYEVCVNSYVLKSRFQNRVVCGFIEIVPSFIIIGTIYPKLELLLFYFYSEITITVTAEEPDWHLPLDYKWRTYFSTSFNMAGKTRSFWAGHLSAGDTVYTLNGREVFKDFYYEVSCQVSIRSRPTISRIFYLKLLTLLPNGYFALPISIRCKKSCNSEMISTKQTLVLSSEWFDHDVKYNLGRVSDFQCVWDVYEFDKWLSDQDFLNMFGYQRIRHCQLSHTPTTLTIPGSSLKKNTLYKFKLFAEFKFNYLRPIPIKSFASYVIRLEPSPVGKGCKITPKVGTAVFTRFKVACKDYKDAVNSLPLKYRLYQLEFIPGTMTKSWAVVAYSGHHTIDNFTLSTHGNATRLLVQLAVEVTTMTGSTAWVPLEVQLTVPEQEETLNKIGNIKVENGGQEDARSVKDVATVLNVHSTTSFDDKVMIRKNVLSNVKKLDVGFSDNIEQVSHVLAVSVENEEEIELSGVDNGINTAHKLAKYLSRVGTKDVNRTKNLAETQFNALSKLLLVSSNYGQSISSSNATVKPELVELKKQNVDQGLMATTSFGNIAGALLSTVSEKNKSFEMQTDFVKFLVNVEPASKTSQFKVEAPNAKFTVPSLSAGVMEGDVMEAEYEVFKKNPYGWTASEVHGNLPVVKVNLVKQADKRSGTDTTKMRFSKPADVFLKFNASAEENEHTLAIKLSPGPGRIRSVIKSSCILMAVKVSTASTTALKISTPQNLLISVKAKYTNVLSYFDEIPDTETLEMPLKGMSSIETSNTVLNRQEDLFFLPQLTQQQIKRTYPFFRVKISIRLNQPADLSAFKTVLNHSGLSRGADENDEDEEPGVFVNVTVRATPFVMSCLHFDEKLKSYISDECMISMYSNLSMMYCRCIVAAAFTGSFLVLPRLIDPLDLGLFLHIFKNPLVVSMVLSIWMIFFALLVWGRQKDKYDIEKTSVTVLEDNKKNQSYVYLVCVVTGWSRYAGTSSNVFMYLKGKWHQSDTHVLQDPIRRLFLSASEDWFVLTAQRDLGELKSVVVWTDFYGAFPAWFLNTIYVQNMQTGESWVCPYNSWISVRHGSGQLLAEVPAFKEREYFSKKRVQFLNKCKDEIRNGHLWFGIVAKTPYNTFTRVRRLAIGLSLLQSLMILNLIFFGIEDKDNPGQFLLIMDQKVHVTSIAIGVETSLLIIFLGIILTSLFSSVAPYPKKVKVNEDKRSEFKNFLARITIKRNYLNEESESGEEEQESGSSLHMDKVSASGTSNTSNSQMKKTVGKTKSVTFATIQNMNPHTRRRESSVDATNENTNAVKSIARKGSSVDRPKEPAKLSLTETDYSDELTDVSEAAKQSGSFLLPWWFIYITWTLLAAYNLFLSYYIMLYGLSLGYEKSLDWVVAFFTGFMAEVFFMEPLKTLGVVILFVFLLKHSLIFKERAPVSQLSQSLLLLQERQASRKKFGTLLPFVGCRTPIPSREAKNVLERLALEAAARQMLRDLVVHTIFTMSVLLVVYGHMQVQTQFLQSQQAKNIFLKSNVLDTDQVMSMDDVWKYIKTVVAPEMKKAAQLGSETHDSYPMGVARLRQIRDSANTSSDSCQHLPDTLQESFQASRCSPSPYYLTPDTSNYDWSWSSPLHNVTVDELDDSSPYTYIGPEELNVSPYIGDHGLYTGGGYVFNFGRDSLKATQDRLNNLQELGWLDQRTRCVFLEFTKYNPGTDQFTNVFITFEFTDTGAIFPQVSINSARLFNMEDSNNTWMQLSEMFIVVYVVFYTIVEFLELAKSGFIDYFGNFWNCFEMATVIFTATSGILYFLRYTRFVDIMRDFQKHGHQAFLNFHGAFEMHEFLHMSLAILGAIVMFKMLKVTGFNPFVVIVSRTFRNCGGDILGLGFVSALIMVILATTGLLIFGKYEMSYMSFDRAMVAQMCLFLGQVDYDSLVSVNLYIGRLYYVATTMLYIQLLVNFICSILQEGYELAKSMQFKKEYETISYMLTTVQMYAGFGPKNVRVSTK